MILDVQVVGKLNDSVTLFECGLLQEEAFADRTPVRIEEDKVVAKGLVDQVRCQFDEELRHIRNYSCRPPFRLLAMLTTDDEDEPNTTLQWAKDLLARLREVEHRAKDDKWWRSFLTRCLWPISVWVQELLTALAESDFEQIPTDIKLELESLSKSFNGSYIAECGFRKLTEFALIGKFAQKLSNYSIWHRLHTCGILEEFDRPLVAIDAGAAMAKPGTINKHVFEAPAKQFSLGEKAFDKIEDKKV